MSCVYRFFSYWRSYVFHLISECKVNTFCIDLQVFSKLFLLKNNGGHPPLGCPPSFIVLVQRELLARSVVRNKVVIAPLIFRTGAKTSNLLNY